MGYMGGAFIFIDTGAEGEEYKKTVSVHEYGHTIQSLILGPLYLFVVGIPSFVWCNNKKCIAYRQEQNKSKLKVCGLLTWVNFN